MDTARSWRGGQRRCSSPPSEWPSADTRSPWPVGGAASSLARVRAAGLPARAGRFQGDLGPSRDPGPRPDASGDATRRPAAPRPARLVGRPRGPAPGTLARPLDRDPARGLPPPLPPLAAQVPGLRPRHRGEPGHRRPAASGRRARGGREARLRRRSRPGAAGRRRRGPGGARSSERRPGRGERRRPDGSQGPRDPDRDRCAPEPEVAPRLLRDRGRGRAARDARGPRAGPRARQGA